jgi:hypothetical protein
MDAHDGAVKSSVRDWPVIITVVLMPEDEKGETPFR